MASGQAALECALSGEFDLLVLDLGLPDPDVFTVLSRLRGAGSAIPVVILIARNSVDETIAAIERGAEDYVPKPFRFEELLARIRLRLRDDHGAEPTVLHYGDLSLDLRTRRAAAAGRVVGLTAREFMLLEMFLRNPGRLLSRQELLSHIWGYDFDPGSNILDVYIRHLRRKLGPRRFETVRGRGYRLAPGQDDIDPGARSSL